MRLPAAMLLLAPLLASGPAQAAVLIQIDKTEQQMEVSVDGVPRWTWPVSTGRIGYATPSGAYKAFRMEEDHYSKEWDDAPMPHSIFFTEKGHAIHGSYETRRIGAPASHGCVRLAPDNAAKLFALVKAEGVTNTKVVLTGSETLFARRNPQQPAATARRAPPDDMDRRYYADRDTVPRPQGPDYPPYGYRSPYSQYPNQPYQYPRYQYGQYPYYQRAQRYPYQQQYRRQRSPFPFFAWD